MTILIGFHKSIRSDGDAFVTMTNQDGPALADAVRLPPFRVSGLPWQGAKFRVISTTARLLYFEHYQGVVPLSRRVEEEGMNPRQGLDD